MTSCALVVSDDLIFRSTARQVLGKVGISSVSSGTIGFPKTVISAKFDAVLLDYPEIEDVLKAIQGVRTGKVNRYSIILAFVSDSRGAGMARSAGATFTIPRSPAISADLEQAVQSAYGLILQERRRYERHPVDVSVEILCNGRSANGRMTDLSECGACIECSLPPHSESLQLGFLLPGSNQRLKIEGIAAWTRGSKLGIKFTSVEPSSHRALIEWLRSRENSPTNAGSKGAAIPTTLNS